MKGPQDTDFKVEDLRFLSWGPFSFSLSSGQCMSITGASGSGKSLLLRSLADLDPHEGQIFLDGIEHMSIPAPQWRKKVALLPAKPSWWHETVAEHFTPLDETHLHALGFESDVMSWRIDRLSTGEQQRLALLRLLSNQPRVLLLDEPTASLDPENALNAENLIQDYIRQQQAIVIWVSHDLKQARRVSDLRYVFTQKQLQQTIEADSQ